MAAMEEELCRLPNQKGAESLYKQVYHEIKEEYTPSPNA